MWKTLLHFGVASGCIYTCLILSLYITRESLPLKLLWIQVRTSSFNIVTGCVVLWFFSERGSFSHDDVKVSHSLYLNISIGHPVIPCVYSKRTCVETCLYVRWVEQPLKARICTFYFRGHFPDQPVDAYGFSDVPI